MAVNSASRLYTAEVLALATSLADYPLERRFDRRAMARSRSCGSEVEIGIDLAAGGEIAAIGLKVTACAIGQAAAAIFAKAASGTGSAGIDDALHLLESWLSGSAPLPDWPGLEAIEPARDFPGRHGALLLPWKAAILALSNDTRHG